MTRVHARVVLATLGIPVAVTGIVLALRLLWSSRLPETVAMHWDGSGRPDDFADLAALTLWTPVITGALAAVVTVAALVLLARGRGTNRMLIGTATLLSVCPVGGLLTSVVTSLDKPTWREAVGILPSVGLLLGVLTAAGVLAGFAAPNVPPVRDAVALSDETVGLARGERATWSSGSSNLALTAFCVLLPPLAIGTVQLFDDGGVSWTLYVVPSLLGLLAALGVSRVSAVVDASGLTLTMGVLGMPKRTIPLSDVASATTTELSLLGTGGLGVRSNVDGDTFYKCRGGEALAVTLKSGRRVVATVNRPGDGAGLLNDLVRQAVDHRD